MMTLLSAGWQDVYEMTTHGFRNPVVSILYLIAQAMIARVDLPPLSTFVMALVQADKMGTSLGKVLRTCVHRRDLGAFPLHFLAGSEHDADGGDAFHVLGFTGIDAGDAGAGVGRGE